MSCNKQHTGNFLLCKSLCVNTFLFSCKLYVSVTVSRRLIFNVLKSVFGFAAFLIRTREILVESTPDDKVRKKLLSELTMNLNVINIHALGTLISFFIMNFKLRSVGP